MVSLRKRGSDEMPEAPAELCKIKVPTETCWAPMPGDNIQVWLLEVLVTVNKSKDIFLSPAAPGPWPAALGTAAMLVAGPTTVGGAYKCSPHPARGLTLPGPRRNV